MAEKYRKLYAMDSVVIYDGATKPDDPNAPSIQPIEQKFSLESEELTFNDEDDVENQKPIPTASDTHKGWIALGISVQAALYFDKDLLKVIRLYSIDNVNQLFPGCTKISLNNVKDGLALGGFQVASLTLQASNAAKVYPLFGLKHSTTIVLSKAINKSELGSFIQNKEIKINDPDTKYKVVPGSFKLKTIKQPTQEIA